MGGIYEVLLEMGSAAMMYPTYQKDWFIDSKVENGWDEQRHREHEGHISVLYVNNSNKMCKNERQSFMKN
jgi:hypothetical protein